ncbi:unnamed protein product, partial [Hapterophycus canaliculatus]
STSLIVLAVFLAVLVLGNVLCAGWYFMCKPQKRQAPPPTRRDLNQDAELGRVKQDLEAEHNRRIRAEALVQRSKGGGIRPSDFPSVRDVDRHVGQLADDALAWTERACAIGGSHAALLATMHVILENTFIVCREEVERCFAERLQNLSAFLGNEEPVSLSGEESMNLDTEFVLYECLCRNFESIVPSEPEHMEKLASVVQRRCGSSADRALTNKVLFGEDVWPSFLDLMQNYILVFVEMTLQRPRMDFGDSLGNCMSFDPRIHRDCAPYVKAPVGQRCSIILPAVRPVRGRPTSSAKIGVVRIPDNYAR